MDIAKLLLFIWMPFNRTAGATAAAPSLCAVIPFVWNHG